MESYSGENPGEKPKVYQERLRNPNLRFRFRAKVQVAALNRQKEGKLGGAASVSEDEHQSVSSDASEDVPLLPQKERTRLVKAYDKKNKKEEKKPGPDATYSVADLVTASEGANRCTSLRHYPSQTKDGEIRAAERVPRPLMMAFPVSLRSPYPIRHYGPDSMPPDSPYAIGQYSPYLMRFGSPYSIGPVVNESNLLPQAMRQEEPAEFLVDKKRRGIAVIFFVLEATSFILDVIGNNKWSFLLPSFLLSILGFALTIYGNIKKGSRGAETKTQADKQLEVTEIVFSTVQLIVTFIHFILAVLGVKSTTNASAFPLVFAIIILHFAFQKNRKVTNAPPYSDNNTSSTNDFPIDIPSHIQMANVRGAEVSRVNPDNVSCELQAVGQEICDEQAIKISPSTSIAAEHIENKNASLGRSGTSSRFEEKVVGCDEIEAAGQEFSELHAKTSNDCPGIKYDNASNVIAESDDGCAEAT